MASTRRTNAASPGPVHQNAESKISIENSDGIESPDSSSNVTYWSIFRFATTYDLIGLCISASFAIAGGIVLPCLTILFGNLSSSFRDVTTGEIPAAAAREIINRNSLYLVYFALGELVAVFVGTAGFSIIGEHITLRIRERYLEGILRQDLAYFDNIQSGEIASNVSKDVNLIQDGISEKVALILAGLAAFFASLVISFVKSWKLTLIVLSTIVAFILAMGVGGKTMIGTKTKALESQGTAAGIAEEAVSSIRVTTAFGAQNFLLDRYMAALNEAQKWGLQVRFSGGMMVGVVTCVIYMEHALSFWQGARFLVDDKISVGALITIQLALMMGGAFLAQLLPQLQALPVAVAAAKRVFSTIDRRSAIDSLSSKGVHLQQVRGEVAFSNVTFNYPSRTENVFSDLSFKIASNKTTAFVGGSGCGKTTIISLLSRFYDPSSGQITLDDHDISELNIRFLRQNTSLVGQEPILFSGSIFDNIETGLGDHVESFGDKSARMERVVNAAKIANAHDFISKMPRKYETAVGERGVLLSGGQKQRIAIARAIIGDPRILLLDEATSALDSKSESLVQQAIEKASRGRTTIVIAHRLSTVRQADNIIVLSDGAIAEQGTYASLMDRGGLFRQLVQAQELNVQTPHLGDIVGVESEHALANDNEKDRDSLDIDDIEKPALREESPAKPGPSQPILSFMWSLNKSEKWFILLGLLCSVISGTNQPIRGILFGHSVMAVSLPISEKEKIRHDSNFWAAMFVVLALVQLFALSGQGFFFGISSENLVRRAQGLAFRSILREDISFFDKPENSPGKLSSLLSKDANSIAGLSGSVLGAAIVFSTTVFGSIGIALAYGWKLALVCMSVMPVFLGCGFLRFWVLASYDKKVLRTGEAAGFASEVTNGIKTVASFTMERKIIAQYRRLLSAEAFGGIGFILKSSAAYAFSQAIIFGGSALGFWYGGNLIANGEYTVLAFFICFTETLFGAQAAGNIVSFAPEIGTGTGAARSFQRLIESEPKIDVWAATGEDPSPVKGTIEFRDVHFRYPQRQHHPALAGLNITAAEGRLTAIVGPSGSGKSTALALIERFYSPSGGSVLLDGRDISGLNLRLCRGQMALVSQDTTLYTGTIKENLCLDSANVSQEDVETACRTANIYDFIISLPDGFNTLIGTKGNSLSGGQRQRIAIARALLRKPKVLLLDEATSALDTASEKVVEEALKAASQGRTTIAIAHRLSSISHADLIYVLEGGRVAEAGTHAELISQKGIYWNMARLQNLGA